ncbi:MAG: terminase small subunit [Maritimibacter sp.]|uniref:terminase small subunit n=1 Tax=Maritimibacter sp. TaxID=2003363 RepID=UPI001DD297B0|nr:terminase small subunit [Maritimibacter sp.]MBL6427336.1 terminase small subunit [Maritimibacter sp.]
MTEKDLAELRAKFPLPDHIKDTPVNRYQLAQAMDVSEPTITKWLQDLENPLPVLEVGGNGREYKFRLADCYAWRMARNDAEQLAKDEASRSAAQLALLFRNADDGTDPESFLTARQVKDEADADYARNRAAELRGELVRASRVEELFELMIDEFKKSATTLADFCEMEFGLDPAEVEKIQRRADEVLIQSRVKFQELIDGRRAGVVGAIVGDQGEMGV